MEQYQRLCDQFSTLKHTSRKFFLEGKITLDEAMKFSELSRSEYKRAKSRLHQLHLKRHALLVAYREGMIDVPVASISALGDELDAMPRHIVDSVLSGSITLIQARYAARQQFGKKSVKELCRVNTPTQPHRVRKYASGTEHSVRSPVVVRPRSRHAYRSTRS